MSGNDLRRPQYVALASRLADRVAALKYREAALAGLGGFITILSLAMLTAQLDRLLLIAPFGASCVLVFALPESPLAQPRNVIGGHFISTLVGLGVLSLLGAGPVAFALGVGLAISAMMLTRTLHPPAGADPIVVMLAGASWPFLFTPVLLGTVFIVVLAGIYRRMLALRAGRAVAAKGPLSGL